MKEVSQQGFLNELIRLLMRASTGRLDARAPVHGDQTGPLADAVNHALGSFRGLVLEVRGGCEQLAQSVGRARTRSNGLAAAMDNVRGKLSGGITVTQELVASVQRSQGNAQQCCEAAARSLEMVREARSESEQARTDLDRMRNSMNETGKRLKRLAESCQEIGDAARLIDDVADQTGVLAVNAAIQVSISGADDGFGVIVEEVRRLSEQARSATRGIDGLVRAIQSESSEAVKAAERTTAELVASYDAGERGSGALKKAEGVAQSLSSAVESIAGSLSRQGQRATAIATELAGAERDIGQLHGDTLAVGVALDHVAEVATVLDRAQEPFRVTDNPETTEARTDASGSASDVTDSGTIVLKPAQLKSAAGASPMG